MNKVMLGFKHDLMGWGRHIKRLAYLTTLEVEDLPNQEFILVGKWQDGGEFRQTFTQEFVLGRFITAPPRSQHPRMRVCRFRDDFIRSVLHARGI